MIVQYFCRQCNIVHAAYDGTEIRVRPQLVDERKVCIDSKILIVEIQACESIVFICPVNPIYLSSFG